VLAYLDKDVREDLVGSEPTKLTGQTLVAPAALGRDLDTVRERGYALEKEEAVLGEGGVAAPIFDRRSEAVGAIGVVGPRERVFGRGRDKKLGTAVIEAARAISRDLGATRWPPI
jgi:DNA-binding IclR family transcriptional regulator